MDQQINATGRPRNDGESALYDGKLYKVLAEKLPSEYVHRGRVNTAMLREQTGNARFTIYRWFSQERLSKKAIKALVKISDHADRPDERGRLTKDDLVPFLLND
ncbi:hypothetical protein VH566_11830 [Rhizobium wenxiniae]